MIPTRKQCLEILSDYCVPARVQQHCLLVAKAAVRLGSYLNSRGYSLDIQAIEAAALLHDIERTKPNHAGAGADLLFSKGYVEIAEIVRQHMKPDPEERSRVSEVTVVYLADKYAGDDGMVSLEKRFLNKRHSFCKDPAAIKFIEENYRTALALQDVMERELGCQDGLFALLRQEHNNGGGLR